MSDLRITFNKFANIPVEDFHGMRAPFLQIGGDEMFSMLKDSGIEYDCSIETRDFMERGLFPYTLDYHSTQVGL